MHMFITRFSLSVFVLENVMHMLKLLLFLEKVLSLEYASAVRKPAKLNQGTKTLLLPKFIRSFITELQLLFIKFCHFFSLNLIFTNQSIKTNQSYSSTRQ